MVCIAQEPTYVIPAFANSASIILWALVVGPIAGLASVGYVLMVTWADRHRPKGWGRITPPIIVIGALGIVSIWFPQILGNGKDISQLAFTGQIAPLLLLVLLVLKPAATILCMRSGAPGGMFTPSLGGVLGLLWSHFWPGAQPGIFALLGAGAVVGATTQSPISAVVSMMELTGRDRSFILPMLRVVGIATLTARSVDARSIYDVRLTDEEIEQRQKQRDLPSQ